MAALVAAFVIFFVFAVEVFIGACIIAGIAWLIGLSLTFSGALGFSIAVIILRNLLRSALR